MSILFAALTAFAIHEAFKDDKPKNNRAPVEPVYKNPNKCRSVLDDMYAKFAICSYIAWADGSVSPEEKRDLDSIYDDLYDTFMDKEYDYYEDYEDEICETLDEIHEARNFNFIKLEKYLQKAAPESIASYLRLADEIAESDGQVSQEERQCIYKIRKYLSDRTGRDYTGSEEIRNFDMRCPGCYATMEYDQYNNRAACPYCGYTKVFGHSMPDVSYAAGKQDPQPNTKLVFECPSCHSKLSVPSGTQKCLCGKCGQKITLKVKA